MTEANPNPVVTVPFVPNVVSAGRPEAMAEDGKPAGSTRQVDHILVGAT